MGKRTKFIALAFVLLFAIGLVPFGFAHATTSYATDDNDGSTVTPTVDPFSDYDFDETYPKADVRNPFNPTSYSFDTYGTLSGGSLDDVLRSDDTRISFKAWKYYESTPDANYWRLRVEFTLPVPSGYSDSMYLIFEGYYVYKAASMQVWNGGSWVTLYALDSSEASHNDTISSSNIISGQVKLRIYMDATTTGSGYDSNDAYVHVDRLYLWGVWNGKISEIYAEDFNDVVEWVTTSGTGTIVEWVTDGDIATLNFSHNSDFMNGKTVLLDSFDADDVVFVEINITDVEYGGDANSNSGFIFRVYDGSTVYDFPVEHSAGVYRYNVKEKTSGANIRYVYVNVKLDTDGSDGWCQIKIDYLRFYAFQKYVYDSHGNIDENTYFYQDSANNFLVGKIIASSTNYEWLNLKQDLTDFNVSDYQYVRVRAKVSDSNAKIQLRVYYTDATYLEIAVTDTSWNETTYDLDSGKTVDYILITIGDSSSTVSSGTYYGYIDYISFSIGEIDIHSISVNFEDTWLSPDQSISITSIIAKWSDGTTISESNFKVDFWENSTIQQSNTSATISRTVQLWNTTYQLGISWCNDSRYRFWVLGSNYSFWIIGSNMSIGFEYDWNIIDSGGFLGIYYQSTQATWDNNGSVVSEQPTFYWWSNSTSKGYATLPTTGWISDFRYQISEGSSAEWVNIWVNATKGDWWQIIYNTTVNVIDLAYEVEFNAISWSESQSEINAFIEISGGGYLKAYENYSNLVAPLQSDGTIKWSKATTLGRVRVDIMCSKFSDFRSYANVTFYYDVERILVYVRYYWSGDNTTSLNFHDFHLYVNSEFQIFEPFFVDSSTNLNITVNDRLENTLFQVTNYNLTGVDNGIALIEITLTYYNLYIQNSGYEPIYIDLYCGDVKLPERIVIPAQATWGPIKVYNTTYSYIAYHKGADSNTYETFKEGDFTVTGDYRLDLSSKSEVDVPDYPNYGGFNWDKFIVMLSIALAIVTVIIIVSIAVSTSRTKTKKEKKKQKVDLTSLFVKEWEKERKKEWKKVR